MTSLQDRLRLALIVGATFLIAISGIVGLYVISQSNERNYKTETSLYELAANAHGLDSNEWEGIARTKIAAELQESSERFRSEMLKALQVIHTLEGREELVDKVQPAAAAYLSAMDEEFALISRGQLDKAREVDESRVDPAFELLDRAIRNAISKFETRARRRNRTALLASVGTLLGCLGSILFLSLRFEHARSLQKTNERLRELLSQLSLSQERAQEASRAKSEFLANMSHEIRTPLNGVMGMTDLVLETEITPEQREYLETVKLSSDSLLGVINDILDFSKIEAGKLDLEVCDFNLRDCLESTLKTLALRADEKGLELLCEVTPEVAEVVRGDATRLRQVVVNLVGNAIKFTNEGEVAVKVQPEEAPGEQARFTISDTGIGIPQEKQQLIFDPFSQADSSTTREYGGTGLGLTISARLVRMMGGKIWLDSKVGRGTKFHFTARLEAADAKAVKLESVGQPKILRGVKVLVVDDNRTNRRILEGMLQRWEMNGTSVEDGETALAQLCAAREAGAPYKLILTDMHMPKMDGFALVARIREPGITYGDDHDAYVCGSPGRRGALPGIGRVRVLVEAYPPIRITRGHCESIGDARARRGDSPGDPVLASGRTRSQGLLAGITHRRQCREPAAGVAFAREARPPRGVGQQWSRGARGAREGNF
jgi:signal transduction histidine kinase/CheY-like chemotaxis protein